MICSQAKKYAYFSKNDLKGKGLLLGCFCVEGYWLS